MLNDPNGALPPIALLQKISSQQHSSVFNGVFYNLDAQVTDKKVTIKPEYRYDNENELYEFFEKLGEGAFGTVYRAIFKPSGEEIAVKVLKAERETEHVIALTKQEALLLNKLAHPNIVKVRHLIQLNGKFYMGMDYLPGGSLWAYIKARFQQKRKFSDLEAAALMRGILEAVSYIHERNIMHRDLKPQNILVDDVNDLSTIKLIDFGLGNEQAASTALEDTQCGTLTFMAPEIVQGKKYTKSVDVWATGIIMHLILTGGTHPFKSEDDTYETLREKLRKLKELEPPKTFSKIAAHLYSRLTAIIPHQRYTSKDARRHPWITRKMENNIPISRLDDVNNLEFESQLRKKVRLMQFLALMKMN
jgi:calcium/calmodulin-dependent protein kinase I